MTQEQLSLYWNDTNGTPPPSSGLAATQLSELFRVVGTQAAPVVNVSFVGLGFRDSAIAYFAPHGLPSGGDWALARTGALFFEGVVNVSVASCEFERLDSTAVFLSGYARGAVIADSDFSWLGESAIALWGWGRGSPVERMGPDLTNGDQPRGTLIEGCFARELGIWQKQSSFVFAAETGLSTIRNSVFFNGPRAAINFNEDSIGGSAISRNLGFNMCRESGDHGIFNSWGRLPYLHDVTPDGVPTTQKIMDNIDHNLFIANYNSMAALDHDDASAYYNSSFNVFAYSPFGLKSDFGGHDNAASHSVYAYLRDTSWFDGPAMIWSTFGDQYVGHEDSFHNNLVVMDWCTGDPCSSGNMSIGQICNASTSSALPLAAAPLPPLPTFGTNVTLQLVQSLAIGVRHCDFALYATERGIGDADDYIFTVRRECRPRVHTPLTPRAGGLLTHLSTPLRTPTPTTITTQRRSTARPAPSPLPPRRTPRTT